jgi:dinuclear metal center YbgI/SA1388 family protein
MKIKEIISRMESFAPLSLQESYDNSGLILGDPGAEFSKAMVCIDVTAEVIDEAIKKGCNLLISHHPLIFGGIKRITAADSAGACIIKAIKNNLAIYAAHTNLDNVVHGVNSILCKKLGIRNCRVLKPKKKLLKKLVTFCPTHKADVVRTALFNAGAGHIGNYDCCSYNIDGTGSFRALENASPYVGQINKLHFEKEVRIETIYPEYLEKPLLKALFSSHPYEEVAYDIYPLDNAFSLAGEGMTGELDVATDAREFLQKAKTVLGSGSIRHTALPKKKIKKIAVCGGAGGFLVKDALSAGADLFLTADLKYHQFFEGEGRMVIADAGHYETEQFAKEILVDFLNENFPTFAFLISKVKTNPVNYFL